MEEAKTKKRKKGGILRKLKKYRWTLYELYFYYLLMLFFILFGIVTIVYVDDYFSEIVRYFEEVLDVAPIYAVDEARAWSMVSTILLVLLLFGIDDIFYFVVGFFKDDVWWRPSFLYLFPRLLMVIILIASELYFILFKDGYYLITSISITIFLLALSDFVRFIIWVIRKALGK